MLLSCFKRAPVKKLIEKTRRFYAMEEKGQFLKQEEAIKIDEELFSRYGFKVEQLMELAGLACAQAIYDWKPATGDVLVLCGPGNNGGDGFVCARHLQMFGYSPTIIYPKESKNELMRALVKQCEGMTIPLHTALPNSLDNFKLVVDAFFGFSFKPPVREPFGEIITRVRDIGKPVFSIDIPSGWDVENGRPSSDVPHFEPEAVISLTTPKFCMKGFKGLHYLGGRFVPRKMIEEHGLRIPNYPDSSQFIRLS